MSGVISTLMVCTVVCQSLRLKPGHGDLQAQTQLMAQGFNDLPLPGQVSDTAEEPGNG